MNPTKIGVVLIILAIAIACAPDERHDRSGDPAASAFARGDYDAAESIWRERLLNAQERGASEEAASALCSLSLVHERRGLPEKAANALAQCIDEASPGGGAWMLGVQGLARLHEEEGDRAEARRVLLGAVEALDPDLPADRAKIGPFVIQLASLSYKAGDLQRAEREYSRVVELEAAVGSPTPILEMAWRGLVKVYVAQGLADEARRACTRWDALPKAAPDPSGETDLQCSKVRSKQ